MAGQYHPAPSKNRRRVVFVVGVASIPGYHPRVTKHLLQKVESSVSDFASAAAPMHQGVSATVKWFNPSKGFGFVAMDDGSPDAFLHISVVERCGFAGVAEGAVIRCDIAQGNKGPQVSAIHDVTPAAEGPSAPSEPVEGVVKFFNGSRGFGFVAPDVGGKDVYVGSVALERSGLGELESGQRVRLETRMGKKGPMADRVEVL